MSAAGDALIPSPVRPPSSNLELHTTPPPPQRRRAHIRAQHGKSAVHQYRALGGRRMRFGGQVHNRAQAPGHALPGATRCDEGNDLQLGRDTREHNQSCWKTYLLVPVCRGTPSSTSAQAETSTLFGSGGEIVHAKSLNMTCQQHDEFASKCSMYAHPETSC